MVKIANILDINLNVLNQDSLNAEQHHILRQVYLRCLPSEKPAISLINGPPGTGKSKLIANLIMQLIYGPCMRKPKKILVCAHTNAAVDVIVKKLHAIRRANPLRKFNYHQNNLKFHNIDG